MQRGAGAAPAPAPVPAPRQQQQQAIYDPFADQAPAKPKAADAFSSDMWTSFDDATAHLQPQSQPQTRRAPVSAPVASAPIITAPAPAPAPAAAPANTFNLMDIADFSAVQAPQQRPSQPQSQLRQMPASLSDPFAGIGGWSAPTATAPVQAPASAPVARYAQPQQQPAVATQAPVSARPTATGTAAILAAYGSQQPQAAVGHSYAPAANDPFSGLPSGASAGRGAAAGQPAYGMQQPQWPQQQQQQWQQQQQQQWQMQQQQQQLGGLGSSEYRNIMGFAAQQNQNQAQRPGQPRW